IDPAMSRGIERIYFLVFPALAEYLAEIVPLDERHHNDGRLLGLLNIENRHQVGMAQVRSQDRLLAEALHHPPVRGQMRMEDLDRRVAFQFAVPDLEHLAHAAMTDFIQNVKSRHRDGDVGMDVAIAGRPGAGRRLKSYRFQSGQVELAPRTAKSRTKGGMF